MAGSHASSRRSYNPSIIDGNNGEDVLRDIMYDGNPAPEPGAIVCRVAPSFLRFGSFQIHALNGDIETLRTLVDYTIQHHFPEHSPLTDDASSLG